MLKKKTMFLVSLVGVLVLSLGVIFADSFSPLTSLVGLTGEDEQVLYDLHVSGETYGEIAEEYGVLEAFKSQMLEIKKDNLQALVDKGTLTQDEADALIVQMTENALNCDPENPSHMGIGFGLNNGQGFGHMNNRQFNGQGFGNGGHMNGNQSNFNCWNN